MQQHNREAVLLVECGEEAAATACRARHHRQARSEDAVPPAFLVRRRHRNRLEGTARRHRKALAGLAYHRVLLEHRLARPTFIADLTASLDGRKREQLQHQKGSATSSCTPTAAMAMAC